MKFTKKRDNEFTIYTKVLDADGNYIKVPFKNIYTKCCICGGVMSLSNKFYTNVINEYGLENMMNGNYVCSSCPLDIDVKEIDMNGWF